MKTRIAPLLAVMPFLLSVTAFEPIPPPAGAEFSPYVTTASLTPPLEAAEITDPFGWRFHPMTDRLDFHYGIDLAAEQGTPVCAVLGGTVTVSEKHESYGKYLVIEHGSGFSTLYAHCSRLLADEGDHVRAGQQIAGVGQTGDATGPHLHFEMIRNGIRLDPIYVLEYAP